MNAQQYRNALEKLGWTQARAAEELGIHERTSRKYALGERPIPLTIVKLMEYKLREKR
jgi:transcriptional regulator with XRE-family HTH domain